MTADRPTPRRIAAWAHRDPPRCAAPASSGRSAPRGSLPWTAHTLRYIHLSLFILSQQRGARQSEQGINSADQGINSGLAEKHQGRPVVESGYGTRSFLRHSGLAQPGEIGGFEQGAELRRAKMPGVLQPCDARITGDRAPGKGPRCAWANCCPQRSPRPDVSKNLRRCSSLCCRGATRQSCSHPCCLRRGTARPLRPLGRSR